MQRLLANFIAALRSKPRHTTVLAVLLLALVFLALRQSGGGLAEAEAVSDDGSGGEVMPGALSTPDIGRSAELVAQWRQQPVAHLSRNLFASELTKPALDAADAAARPPAGGLGNDGLFWRQLEQVLASRADREQYRRTLGEAALRDATGLSVKSIVIGPDSRALVGEKLVRVGDVVGGGERGPFTVAVIEPTRVILARDGHRLVTNLGRPGVELFGPE